MAHHTLHRGTRARYRVLYSKLSGAYLIADELLGDAICSLPDETGRNVRLKFRTGKAARDWLAACGTAGGWWGPQDRYEVREEATRYVIMDLTFRQPCSLHGRKLSWDTRKEASDWLVRCYRAWGESPALGDNPPPESQWGKRRYTPSQSRSPWETYRPRPEAYEDPSGRQEG